MEQEIIKLASQGYSAYEIAQLLELSLCYVASVMALMKGGKR